MSAGGNCDGHDCNGHDGKGDGNCGNRPYNKGPARSGNEHGDTDPDANSGNNHKFSREDVEVMCRVIAEHSELPGILRNSFTT
ncbi:hypothetical protein HK405_004109, partial [Cladochytrium tenue]